eukprot:scaffold124996_cov26-Prasinocladus_malaysianus.AAC.1
MRSQGSRPQANTNIRLDEKPSVQTTQGLCNHQTFRRQAPTVDRSHFTNSNKQGSYSQDRLGSGIYAMPLPKFKADIPVEKDQRKSCH